MTAPSAKPHGGSAQKFGGSCLKIHISGLSLAWRLHGQPKSASTSLISSAVVWEYGTWIWDGCLVLSPALLTGGLKRSEQAAVY